MKRRQTICGSLSALNSGIKTRNNRGKKTKLAPVLESSANAEQPKEDFIWATASAVVASALMVTLAAAKLFK